MNKPELQALCDEAGIEYTEEHTKAQLQEMLDNHEADVVDHNDADSTELTDEEKAMAHNADEDLDDADLEDEDDSEEETELEEGQVKVELKLRRRHPRHSFRVGTITVEGYQFKKYVVDVAILKELVSVGGKHWIAIKEVETEEDYKELEEELSQE